MSEANNFSRPIENPWVKQSEKPQEVVWIQETSPVIEEQKTPLTINEKVTQLFADTELVWTEESIVSLFEGQDEAIQTQAYTELERAKYYGALPDIVEQFWFDISTWVYEAEKFNNNLSETQIIQPFEQKMTTLFSEIWMDYTRDIKPKDILTKLPDLTPEQFEKFKKLLTELSSQSSIDNYTQNNLWKMIAQISNGIIPKEIKEQKTEIKEQTEVVQKQTADILTATEKIRWDLEWKKIIEDKILSFKTSDKIDEDIKKLSISENEKQIVQILSEIIKSNNTQAIEDILMVAAQADPKWVEGETFKAFYAVFETSGVAPDVLEKIREKISTNKKEKSSLNKEQQKAYFTGVTSEPTEDEKGFLTYENQKIDLSEIPPVRYIKTQGNLEIKSTDKEYYTALREKNQKEHRLDTAYKELDQVQSNISRIILQNADFTKELDDKLNQLNALPSKEDPRYDWLSKEIDKLEDNIERNKISLEENKKNQAKLLQEISVLPWDIARLWWKINDRELFLTEKKEKAQNTANFLDNIGFTQIPKDDVDWMLSQVNAFDATYYGFSQPLNFENGFDYQSSKWYAEFIQFFNTLLFGKDKANHKIPNDYKKFTNGTDISNAAPSFQQLLKQQWVLRDDGRLNQFNFFQKFSSRNTEKQPTANASKEGSEAKQ